MGVYRLADNPDAIPRRTVIATATPALKPAAQIAREARYCPLTPRVYRPTPRGARPGRGERPPTSPVIGPAGHSFPTVSAPRHHETPADHRLNAAPSLPPSREAVPGWPAGSIGIPRARALRLGVSE